MTDDSAKLLKQYNACYQWHPMSNPAQSEKAPPLIITRGEGMYVTDVDGNRYVDGIAGLWCVNVGHGRAEVKEAIGRQLDELEYFSSFDGTTAAPSITLSKRLVELLAPEDMERVLFSNGGSDAVETALKLTRQYWKLLGQPQRTKFIGLKHAYHGVHFGGVSAAGSVPHRWAYEPLLPGCSHIDAPWPFRNPWNSDGDELARLVAEQLSREIEFQGPHTVAAFIAEPIQGAGGVIVPPPRFWPLVREVCDRYEVLLIADEVVTGFGRSGSMFGARGWGVKPDIMCFAKGLSSGYVPLGATVFNRRVAAAWHAREDFSATIMHGYTYSGHPVACAAALACLGIVEREDLPANAARQGERLLAALKPLEGRFAPVGEVRGKGLMIAIDLVSDKSTREPLRPDDRLAYALAEETRKHGALVRPVGPRLILSPPLVIREPEADILVEALTRAFEALDPVDLRRPRYVSAGNN